MEKRAILFFILTFLIFYIWSQYFVPNPVTPVTENKIVEETVEKKSQPADETATQTTADQNPISTEEEVLADAAPAEAEKEFLVETPLYIATFSNKGPSLTGFKLKKYRTSLEPDSPLVELFTAHEDIKSHISLYFNNPSLKNGNNLVFSTNRDSIFLDSGSKMENLTFKYISPDGITIEQIFNFSPEKYDIAVDFKMTNNSGIPIDGNIKSVINDLPPKQKGRYYSFTGAAAFFNNELKDYKPKDLDDDEKPDLSGNIDWFAYENEYFISAVAPEEVKGARFTGTSQPSGVITATHFSAPIELAPSSEISKKYSLFLGPKDINIIQKFGHNLDKAIDYGFFSIIAGPLHFVLNFFNRFLNNYGFSIILLTIIIKIIFWPLTHKSQKSMKEMQKLQPLMAKIREKYKDNREMMNKELMGLYRTYKVNPMSGCLPMLIQIPVFFALYRVLGSSIELRQAPFLLWINDLSAPDRLFNWSFSIPFMEPPYGIPVLTLLMGASMFLQQKMQPMVGDPSQAKIMMFMPIMFTVMFINFPSGLVLYWLTQNILSIGQQYYINKKSD
jgi:YidC/Oxa1 family membrane protein insertase